MFTRGSVRRYHDVPAVPRVNVPGYMRQETVNGIQQTWAIARPNSSPGAMGGPVTVRGPGMLARPGALQRGGIMPLTPAKPKLEMDPSDPSTWQRQYSFTA